MRATSEGCLRGDYQRRVAQPGDVLSGQLAQIHPANAGFWLAGDSYPVPLPAGVSAPTLEYRAGGTPSATCPGVGQSTSGRLCVYGINTSNVGAATLSGKAENRRYGFSLDIFPTAAASAGYILANWTYQVP
jgi:hypothetical protein